MLQNKAKFSLTPMWQLHIGVLFLGGAGVFAKLIDLPALDIIAYRSLFTAIVLLAFVKLLGKKIKLNSYKDYGIALVLGLLAGLHWLTYFLSIQKTTIAVAMIALFTYPVITVLIEPLLKKQTPKVQDLFVSLFVLFGISLLFPNLWSSELVITQDYILGIGLGVISALFFALRNLGITHYFTHYSGAQSMFYQLLVSALIFLPFVDVEITELSGSSVNLLILLALFFTAIPHVMFANSLSHVSASTAGMIAFLQPLYGTLLGILLLSEIPSWTTAIGGGIILLAALFETRKVNKSAKLKKSK